MTIAAPLPQPLSSARVSAAQAGRFGRLHRRLHLLHRRLLLHHGGILLNLRRQSEAASQWKQPEYLLVYWEAANAAGPALPVQVPIEGHQSFFPGDH